MKRLYVFGIFTALLVSVSGCGSKDPEGLTKQLISQTNDLAAAIEKKESTDTIKSLAEKMKATSEKRSALKLTPEEAKQLMEKYAKEQLEAGMRLAKAVMGNPEAMAAITSIGGLGDQIQVSSGGTTTTTTTSGFGSGTTGGTGGRTGGKR
jgi:outer membrane murein-binding lipoprotein Lpp